MSRHPSAIVETERVGDGVDIGPFCVVGPQVTLGDGPMARHATIRRPVADPGPVLIGAGCSIGCHVVLYENVTIGDGCLVGDAASILEGAVVGTDAVIGRMVTMHPDVTVGDRTRVLDHAHIATSAVVGDDCVLSLHVSMASDARFGLDGFSPDRVRGPSIGDRVLVGPGAVLLPGIRLDDDVVVGAGAVVTHDVAAGTHVRGMPARAVDAAMGAVP
jgi:acetyltransferase-like isoleucine patch superfamily enzyme